MYNPHSSHTVVYSKDTKSRQSRDNDDEMSLVTAFRGFQVNTGVTDVNTSVTPESLKNLVTKDLATDEIENSLLFARELGEEQLLTFIQERMIVREKRDKPGVAFHASLRKSNAKIFASLFEVVKNSTNKEKKTILKADRNILQRLVTVYEAGRPVDLPAILKYEPVPISLAGLNEWYPPHWKQVCTRRQVD